MEGGGGGGGSGGGGCGTAAAEPSLADFECQMASAEVMWERARAEDKVVWDRQREQRQQEWLLRQAAQQREWDNKRALEQQRWESHRQLQQALWEGWKQRQLQQRRGQAPSAPASSAQQQQQQHEAPLPKRRRLQDGGGSCSGPAGAVNEEECRGAAAAAAAGAAGGRSRGSSETEQTPHAGDGTASAAALLERTMTECSTEQRSGATACGRLPSAAHQLGVRARPSSAAPGPCASSAQLSWGGLPPSGSTPLPPLSPLQQPELQLWAHQTPPEQLPGQEGQAVPLATSQRGAGGPLRRSTPPPEQAWLAAQVEAFEAALQQAPLQPQGGPSGCQPLAQQPLPQPWSASGGVIGAAHAAAADDWWLDSFLG